MLFVVVLQATDHLKTIASEAPRSLWSWTQHIKGATSILRLRGEEQLHTQIGRQLFIQLRSQVVCHIVSIEFSFPSDQLTDYDVPSKAACSTRRNPGVVMSAQSIRVN
jgi:hypothetical protein